MSFSMAQWSLPQFKWHWPTLSRRRPSAALVIRTTEVELLWMQGRKVAGQLRVPTEGTTDQHLIRAIQQAIGAAGLKTKRLAVSVPAQEVLFRFFSIPAVPKAEWDSAVQFESRKYVPFRIESLLWDYRVLQHGGSNRLDVIFAAIQRDSFRRIQDALAAAGVVPTLIEPTSVSLARLLGPAKGKPSNEFVCLVDVEQDTAHLAIVKDRLPYLTRDVSLLPTITPTPSTDVMAPAGSGETPPIDEKDLGRLVEDADPRARRLFSELRVSMDFFMREYPSTSVTQVLLFGEETLLRPWCHWLSEQLRQPVELGSTLLDQRVHGDLPLSFASAVGLGQATKDAGGASLDFLKRSLAKAPSTQRRSASVTLSSLQQDLVASLRMPQTLVSAAVVAGMLLVLWGLGKQQVAMLHHRYDHLVKSRSDVGWGLSKMTVAELEPIRTQAQAQVARLKEIMDHRVSVAAKLDALARSLPDGIWLTGLEFEDAPEQATGKSQPRLTLHGACFLGGTGQELSAIQDLEQRIKHDTKFFSGFTVARVGQINARASPSPQYTYRTFQLHCNSDRRL